MKRNRRAHGVFGLGAAWLLGLLLAVSALAQAEPDDSLIKPLVDEALYFEIVSELKLDDFNTAIAWALYEEYRAAVRVIGVELSLSPYPALRDEYNRWWRLKTSMMLRDNHQLADPIPPEHIPDGYGPEPSRSELDAMNVRSTNGMLQFRRRAWSALDQLFGRLREEIPVSRERIDAMDRLVYRRTYLTDPSRDFMSRSQNWLLDLDAIARIELDDGVLFDIRFRLPRDRNRVMESSIDDIMLSYEIAMDEILRRVHHRKLHDVPLNVLESDNPTGGNIVAGRRMQQSDLVGDVRHLNDIYLDRIANWAEERGGIEARYAWVDRFNQLMFPLLYRPLWIDHAAQWLDELDGLTVDQRNSIDAILAESMTQRDEQRRVVCSLLRDNGRNFRVDGDPVTDADRRLARAQLAIHRTTRNCLAAVRSQLLESQRQWLDGLVYVDRRTPDHFGPAISRSVLASMGELDFYMEPLAIAEQLRAARSPSNL